MEIKMFDLMTPEQKRNVMPMTKYWHIKRGLKKGTETFFEPITFMFGLAADWFKNVAGALQHNAFFKEKH
jgi:hypothetical protein